MQVFVSKASRPSSMLEIQTTKRTDKYEANVNFDKMSTLHVNNRCKCEYFWQITTRSAFQPFRARQGWRGDSSRRPMWWSWGHLLHKMRWDKMRWETGIELFHQGLSWMVVQSLSLIWWIMKLFNFQGDGWEEYAQLISQSELFDKIWQSKVIYSLYRNQKWPSRCIKGGLLWVCFRFMIS